jgi:hypothetical protein
MSIAEFYTDIKKNAKANTELNQLYKKGLPETGKNIPVAQVFNKDIYYQADILYLPEDEGFKYLLVCIDLYDGSLDAEPVKELKPTDIIEAFKEIFKRNYLKFPKFITFDKGQEFKGDDIINYFKKNGTNVKYALTGRSRQLANVERANQKIGTILFKRMTSQELITGETSKEWVSDLKPLIKVLNEHKKEPLQLNSDGIPLVNEYSGKLLKIGQRVRIKLDYPINNTNHARLYGKFRSTDIKWTPKIYKITQILLKPNYPPMYLTDKNDNVARTKYQLSVVGRNEKEPDAKYIRGNPEFYKVAEILDKRKVNNKTEYLIRWRGFKANDATWEPAKVLDRTNDLKAMKKKYNEDH